MLTLEGETEAQELVLAPPNLVVKKLYADQILPQAAGAAPAVTVGAEQLFAIDADVLG